MKCAWSYIAGPAGAQAGVVRNCTTSTHVPARNYLLCMWCSTSNAKHMLSCLQVNHDSFQKMLDEYRSAKATQKDDQLKIKQ